MTVVFESKDGTLIIMEVDLTEYEPDEVVIEMAREKLRKIEQVAHMADTIPVVSIY